MSMQCLCIRFIDSSLSMRGSSRGKYPFAYLSDLVVFCLFLNEGYGSVKILRILQCSCPKKVVMISSNETC